MSDTVEVVYHVVTPGDPDEKAHCCLKGVRLDGTEVDGVGADVEDEAAGEVEVTRGDVDEAAVADVRCKIVSVLAGGGWLRGLSSCISG